MEITVRKYTDEVLMRRACEMTFNGKSHQSLLSIYKSEHSPARTQLFWIEFIDVPLFVATHFIRHHVGVVPFELSRRDDRSNDVTFDVAIKSVNDQLTDLLDHILKERMTSPSASSLSFRMSLNHGLRSTTAWCLSSLVFVSTLSR